jgi:hypothetical protein
MSLDGRCRRRSVFGPCSCIIGAHSDRRSPYRELNRARRGQLLGLRQTCSSRTTQDQWSFRVKDAAEIFGLGRLDKLLTRHQVLRTTPLRALVGSRAELAAPERCDGGIPRRLAGSPRRGDEMFSRLSRLLPERSPTDTGLHRQLPSQVRRARGRSLGLRHRLRHALPVGRRNIGAGPVCHRLQGAVPVLATAVLAVERHEPVNRRGGAFGANG